MKVALVYDRVNKWGGAERVLLTLHQMFPDAPLYTSVCDEKKAPWAKVFPKIYTSFLQKIPFAKSNHEFLGTFMPLAFELFNFDKYDLVISVTSEAAKGIITKPQTKHICYCLTPTRYLWSGYSFYFRNPILKFFAFPVILYLRNWDKIAAQRPDVMLAISNTVQGRIKKYYNRESQIIFPPVETLRTGQVKKNKGNYYLVVSRLVAYKNVDLAIKVFNRLRYSLYVVGKGSQENKLKQMASYNIKFFSEVSEDKLINLYSGARALIMPQEEDFGITSLEAQGLGVPVIAYKKGGVLDSVVDGRTGVFFNKQTEADLKGAIAKFEKMSFNLMYLVKNAEKFSKETFKKQLQGTLVRINFGWRRRNKALA
ncbi:glycosyltransferase [Patescibacteria group bacterium]